MDKFIDRQDAGRVLASHLMAYNQDKQTIILALPRGGVPVAYEIAIRLSLPLDVFIVRKLGVPGYEELAMGAIATGGTIFFNKPLIKNLNIAQTAIDNVLAEEKKELHRREHLYRGNKPPLKVVNQTIILVDDGIATGATISAAIEALQEQHPAKLIIAVPVAAKSTYEELISVVDKVICPLTPIDFHAVGIWYENFAQTSDDEVINLLQKADSRIVNP